MKKWTITVEMKTSEPYPAVGPEKTFIVVGDTASHAKNRLNNRVKNIQYVKHSRPYNPGLDAGIERIG